MRSYIGVSDTLQQRSKRRRTFAAKSADLQRKYKLPRGVAESLLREESL